MTKGDYVEIPGFVRDDDWSGWEGETCHKVGRIHRGDYHYEIANNLMSTLVKEYMRRLAEVRGAEEANAWLAKIAKIPAL